MSVLAWPHGPPKGYTVIASTDPARLEHSARAVMLDAVLLHARGEHQRLWQYLDEPLPGGRRRVVELCLALVELHRQLGPIGRDTLLAERQAKGYRFFHAEVEDAFTAAIAELGPVAVRDEGERVYAVWPTGEALCFSRDTAGLLWRDSTRELLAEITPAVELPAEGASPEASPKESSAAGTPSSPELDLVPAVEAACEVTLAQARAAAEETLRLANVELAAAELRRLHVLARAKAQVERLLADQARQRAETVWDWFFLRGPAGPQPLRCKGDPMCAWCGKGCQGAQVLVRAGSWSSASNPELTVHVSCVEPAWFAQKGPYGTARDMSQAFLGAGIALEGHPFADLELLTLEYRRVKDVLELDWSTRPTPKARKAKPCALCGQEIPAGQVYVDGGKERAAHVKCAGVEIKEAA